MNQISSEKYNIAWFKLAEFVSRGEKERALAMYRLLSHSLEDKAFVQQLEGDLLLSFNDDAAYYRYGKAVATYLEHGRVAEAVAVYEHMVTLEPTTLEELQTLVALYLRMHNNLRIFEMTQHLFRWLMGKGEFEKVSALLQQIDDPGKFAVVHQELVQSWLKVEDPPTDSLMLHVRKIIDHYFSVRQTKALQSFLITIKMLHVLLYQKACAYMQEGNFKI